MPCGSLQSDRLAMKNTPLRFAFLFLFLSLTSCQTAYYEFWEKLGLEKRDLLRDHVSKATREQGQLQEEFQDVLSRIRTEYQFEAGKLGEVYDRMKADHEDAEGRYQQIRERIDKIETISRDLFIEWKTEAETIDSARLREDSLAKLKVSKGRYQKMKASLDQMTKRLDPVLKKMKDYVLYLKHNLNAKSMNAIKLEAKSVEQQVKSLIQSLEKSIEESAEFSKTLK